MTTVSIAKREGLSPFFQRSFADFSEAARFVESWLPMHVAITDQSGQAFDVYSFLRVHKPKESALRPFLNDDGSDAVCPFCGVPEAIILCDDECLHGCGECDRHWYIDNDGNVLPADRCPACESPDVTVDDCGVRTCGACNHRFFFDGLTYVDPETVETESDGVQC